VTSLVIEHMEMPVSTRDLRAVGAAGERAGDVLAGHTVWCAMALPRARRPAEQLRARIDGAGPGISATSLEVSGDERLRRLAERLDEMLAGGESPAGDLGPAEREVYSQSARGSEDLVGDAIGRDDVVVAHDALSAILAEAVRERGAHAVWRVRFRANSQPAAWRALEFLRRFTPGVDAYVVTWLERDPHAVFVERVAAVMPSAGMVAAKGFSTRFGGEQPRRLAWQMALAEILRSDRGESVGGTLRPRPRVAAR
jgi:hypothetical protein